MTYDDFLYHIDVDNNIVYFTPLDIWEKDGICVSDYSSEEMELINKAIEELDLCEVVDAGFEPVTKKNIQSIEYRIIDMGFVKNKKFSKFMVSCLGETEVNDEGEEIFELDDEDGPQELNFDR